MIVLASTVTDITKLQTCGNGRGHCRSYKKMKILLCKDGYLSNFSVV